MTDFQVSDILREVHACAQPGAMSRLETAHGAVVFECSSPGELVVRYDHMDPAHARDCFNAVLRQGFPVSGYTQKGFRIKSNR